MIIACHECQEFSDTWLVPLHVWATTLGGMLCCTSVAADAASPGAVAAALWESVYICLLHYSLKKIFAFKCVEISKENYCFIGRYYVNIVNL